MLGKILEEIAEHWIQPICSAALSSWLIAKGSFFNNSEFPLTRLQTCLQLGVETDKVASSYRYSRGNLLVNTVEDNTDTFAVVQMFLWKPKPPGSWKLKQNPLYKNQNNEPTPLTWTRQIHSLKIEHVTLSTFRVNFSSKPENILCGQTTPGLQQT